MVTVTASDECGNSASVTYNTRIDNTPPAPLAGSVRSYYPTVAAAERRPSAATTATDNCPGALVTTASTVEMRPVDPVCVTDNCGNAASMNYNTRIDRVAPVPVAGTIGSCYPTVAAAQAAAIAATTATDNCPGALVKTASTVGDCLAVVTVVVSDSCGNSASVAYNTRIDSTPPTVACPANITVACAGVMGTPVTFATTANDNCDPSPTVVCTPLSGSAFATGVTTVNCTVQDSCGNVGMSCSFTVTVTDTVRPTISCPPDVVLECPQTLPISILLSGTPTVSDNCDLDSDLTVTHVDSSVIEVTTATPDGWSLRTFGSGTAAYVDGPGTPPLETGSLRLTIGNTVGISAGQNVNYDGKLLSTLTELSYSSYRLPRPGDESVVLVLYVDVDGVPGADDALYFEPRYQDGDNPALPNQGSVLNNTWQTWNALVGGWWSENGLASASPGPGVKSLAAYLAAFPNAKVVNPPAAGGVRLQAGTVTGNWDNFDGNVDRLAIGFSGASTVYDFERIPGLDCTVTKIKQQIIRTWTVTDSSGNQASCSQEIVIRDTAAPVISALPSPSSVECPAVPVFVVPTATDLCDAAPALTFVDSTAPGACPQEYTVTRTWTATDACGNSSTASQTISVTDNTPPAIAGVPAAATVECSAVPVGPATLPATDACDASVTVATLNPDVITAGACANAYTITRTWTAIDACGNPNTATQIITVVDTTAPVISGIPAAATVECNAVPVGPATLPATDACDAGVTAATLNPDVITPGACANAYTITRTWTATDACGNSRTATQVITVVDTTAPVIAGVPPAATVECSAVPVGPATLPATDALAMRV